MKQKIDVFEYAGHICKSLRKGVLLTTACDGRVNTMTIGWGELGIVWNKPIFIAYVRESRFTKHFLDKTREFTVNIPMGAIDPKILGYCGTKSGADCDKIQDLRLTLESPECITVPAVRELPLTLECQVIYTQEEHTNALPQSIQERFYATDETGNQDPHTAFYGEILNAYIITE